MVTSATRLPIDHSDGSRLSAAIAAHRSDNRVAREASSDVERFLLQSSCLPLVDHDSLDV